MISIFWIGSILVILAQTSQAEVEIAKWGQMSPGDILLDSQVKNHRYKYYLYPSVHTISTKTITEIRVTEVQANHKTGDAVIVGGGINSNTVKIALKKKYKTGFQYKIDVYGH